MVFRNGFYFLICNKDNYDDMTHYRIDRMTDVTVEDLPVKSPRQLKGFESGWNLQEYMEHNINMAFGRPERFVFRAWGHAIPGIIDAFGKGVTFRERPDGFYDCEVRVPEYDMELFAMAHWADITVTHPPAFVKKMQKNAETLCKNYAAEKE